MKPVFMLKVGSHVLSLRELEAPHSPVLLPRSRTMIFFPALRRSQAFE